MTAKATRGFSLPELMVAMALGLLLLAAFMVVVQRCRDAFASSESLAALQDNARHALSVILRDLEHAGYLGFSAASDLRYTRGGTVIAEGAELHQPDATHAVAAVPGLPAGTHDCGENSRLGFSHALGTAHTRRAGRLGSRDHGRGTGASREAPSSTQGTSSTARRRALVVRTRR